MNQPRRDELLDGRKPKQRPRKRLAPLRRLLHHVLKHPNLISVFIASEVSAFGVISSLYYKTDPITQIGGIPIYSVYPWSLAIFGAFGALISLKDGSGLATMLGGAAMFDLTGVVWAGKNPSPSLFLLWMLAISVPFLVQRKNIGYFVIHPAFLIYIVIAPSINLLPTFDEAIAEVVFCVAFYFAFYDNFLPTDPRNPMKALAHIT